MVVLVAFMTACTPQQDPNKIIVSGPFEPINLDPASTGYIFSRMQVLETLVDVGNNGELLPGLATSWLSNDDFTQWTFTLRQNVYFHDGQPMTVEAVYKSLAVALGKPTPFAKNILTNLEIVSPSQIRFTLNQSYRPFPSLMSNYSMAIIAPSSFGTFNRIKNLVATGPYQIVHFEPPHNITTERFEQYWGEPAHIRYAEYITGHRAETRALMVRTGQADIVYNLDPAAVNMLGNESNVTVHSNAIPRTTLIKLNIGNEILSDRSVREALSLAIDRTGIAEGILRVPGVEANQIFGPMMGDWHLHNLPPPATHTQRANQLLNEAGWQKRDDGWRYRDNQRLTLNMITYANRPELIIIATAIQEQWARIGVELNVQMENVSAIPSGHADGSLQTALMARNFANIPNPLGIMLADFTSKAGGEWGPMNWSNPAVFSGVRTLSQQTETEQASVQIANILKQIHQDLPLIPVTFYIQQTATSARVKNFSFDPFERSFRLSAMRLEHGS
ncbi:MAG: ABC transporter substrate-binding protein [Alteromonadaceae bacterium]|nr:ABC transporter substrate-binding protein [Alteromonadaceae bacterium]